MPQLIAMVEGVEVKHVYLHKDRTTLGRRPENDIVLDTLVVSGTHCTFDLVGVADVFLEDKGSTNGTYVNDHMVKSRTRLHDGDVIAIGPFRIKYLQASEQPSSFGETSAMTLESHAAAQPVNARFQVMTGSSAGLEVPVVKAVTTFGKPGVTVVSVSHRRTGYFVAHLAGSNVPTLNGRPIGDEPVQLADQDVLDLAGTQMKFLLRE
ncbi:FHA domain-containing protein [Caenimonas sedimenti]|uniref:FHA domain-containing protein n=1 Tax=Caenimonas sedimenti TaxID=2596921 RepID=A0A562ZSX3_9BURK|nr:FHA domain-containing protein [Caenimonas sedimenti]TWO71692.1 FHA domain-containing protein [Caenimonas sedimenti]